MISTTQLNVNFRHIFRDIVAGSSKITHNNQAAYLKHLSVFDQVDIEDIKIFYYEKAKKRGLPTQSESLKRLEEEGLWTSADEGKIKDTIGNLLLTSDSNVTKYNIVLETHKESGYTN